MGPHFLVGLDVARYAQGFKIGGVVCEPLHFLCGLSCLHRLTVVNING